MNIDPEIMRKWREAIRGREDEVDSAAESTARMVMLMAHLRSPEGCPWDGEQSLASLRQYVMEEAEEVCHAIDRILEFEAGLRTDAGLPEADPSPPEGEDQARTEKKGHTIAHHPHRADFAAHNSASGAPLPSDVPVEQKAELDQLYIDLAEELGDLLLQPVFQADILQAMGRPGLAYSVELLLEKLIRRHPHVYGDGTASNSAEVLSNWEKIKQVEKGIEDA